MKAWTRTLPLVALVSLACSDDGSGETNFMSSVGDDTSTTADTNESGEQTGDGDGDPGDGDPGDGDPGDGDPGDGDGDPGDGDPGDGDGDPGDGDPGDGDGDPDLCPLQLAHVPCDDADDDPFHALGLDCPGNEPEVIPLVDTTFTAPDSDSWKVATQYGSSGDWSAHEGEKLLIISTGALEDPDQNGHVLLVPKSTEIGTPNGNPDNVNNLPNPIEPQDGGNPAFMNCDGQNDCSNTLQDQWDLGESQANDLLFFSFDITVPVEANGYEFDFAFFSAEYPEWIDTQYNDIFVVWSTSESYTGNVTFINGQPITVTALENYFVFEGNDPEIADTGA